MHTCLVVLTWLASFVGLPDDSGQFEAPFQLRAGDVPIDADMGNAAPFVCDFDGDGKSDLLVGQFDDGKLRVYRNVGSAEKPRFEDFDWFEAGGATGSIPAG